MEPQGDRQNDDHAAQCHSDDKGKRVLCPEVVYEGVSFELCKLAYRAR